MVSANHCCKVLEPSEAKESLLNEIRYVLACGQNESVQYLCLETMDAGDSIMVRASF